MSGDRPGKFSFTLVELVAVLAIILLTTGLVIGRVGKTPAFYSVEQAANETISVFTSASTQALARGRSVSVVYNPESRSFSVSGVGTASKNSLQSCRIPDFVELDIQNGAERSREFVFHPDGSASGPDVRFSMKGRAITLSLSPLTGMVMESRTGTNG